jgi:histidinol dehydrogenase
LAIRDEIYRQAETLSRQGPLSKVLANGVFLIQAENMQDAAEIAGNYAPEHLELMCRNAAALSKKIKAAGAIFLGNWTPEPAGDFTAGPSHVLPTAGTAKFFHGISAADFMRRSSIVKYTEAAILREVSAMERIADMEGLDAHKRSASIRRTK